MNDYRQKQRDARSLLLSIVGPIVENLPGWHIVDEPEIEGEYPPNDVTVANAAGQSIRACWEGYGEQKRIRFTPNTWPKWTDETGRTNTATPRDCIAYDAETPATSVAATRKSHHAANQVMAKVITPYLVMYDACAARAKERGEYANGMNAQRHALLAACGLPERDIDDRRGREFSWYCGDRYISVEQRGSNSIRVEGLTTAEAVALLTRIREAQA